jgi:uncharacterized protein
MLETGQEQVMDRAFAGHQSEIAELCRKFRVRRLELFGSAATGSPASTSSDLDFLVEFEKGRQGELGDTYFGLKESLEGLLGRPVHLVMPSAVSNPYLLRAIEAGKTELYAVKEWPAPQSTRH